MLQFSELKKRNLLSNESMSNVRGGSIGSCGFVDANGGIDCGVSKADALEGAAGGGRWCCDSCSHSFCSGYAGAYAICEP